MTHMFRSVFFAATLLASAADATTLRIASASLPPALGNPYGSIAQSASHTRTTILDGLVRIGPGGKLQPALALSWEPIDKVTWRFKLRPNVFYSNGEPFNAANVKYVFDWLKSPAAAAQLMATEARGVSDVRVVDDLTVDIITPQTDAVLPKRLTLILMVPPQAFAKMGVDTFTQTPIGTGAYILKDWGQSTGRTVIEAYPKSWRAPKQITKVELYPLKEPVSRMQALTSGRVDIAQGLGPEDVEMVKADGFHIYNEHQPQIMALALRNTDPAGAALKDIRVRQALNYAVDKDAIANVILRGTANAAGQGAIPGVTGYNPNIKPYPHDVAKAKALLAEAGYASGLKLVARVGLSGPTEANAIYQKVQADLAEAGVQLELRPVLPNDWVRMYTSGDWGGADIISSTWNAASYHDTIRAFDQYSCRKPGLMFCAPEIEPLIDASNAELDPAKREVILQDIMAKMHTQAPTIFLVNFTSVYAYTDKVNNIALGSAGLFFEDMTLKE
jgi:peptide/nickel transport system substrate-binding protein